MLKDGDLLYYKYLNGITVIIEYYSKFDGKNVSLDSLSNTSLLDKVVRNGEIIWEKRGTNNTSSRQEDKKVQ